MSAMSISVSTYGDENWPTSIFFLNVYGIIRLLSYLALLSVVALIQNP